jgi:hypothetical protein
MKMVFRKKSPQETLTGTPAIMLRDTTASPLSKREQAMRAEQAELQIALGIDGADDTQAWLRLHQILKNYEDRITALENRR